MQKISEHHISETDSKTSFANIYNDYLNGTIDAVEFAAKYAVMRLIQDQSVTNVDVTKTLQLWIDTVKEKKLNFDEEAKALKLAIEMYETHKAYHNEI